MEGDILLGSYEALTTRQNRRHTGLISNFSKFRTGIMSSQSHYHTISSVKADVIGISSRGETFEMQGGQWDMKKCFRRMGSFYFEKYWDLYFR